VPNDPMVVRRKGRMYCVQGKSASGPAGAGRCHSTRAAAIKQMQAINLSMIKQGTLKPKKR